MSTSLLFTLLFAITTALPLEETSSPISHTDDSVLRWNKESYPNPRVEYVHCGRSQPSHVCDPHSILSPDEADTLDFMIDRIKNDTVCVCQECGNGPEGITIGIALVNQVYRRFHHEAAEEVKGFAEYLRKSWNLGTCDDDVIILISTGDRQYYLSSGEAATKAISSEQTDRIFVENKGHFQSDHYYQGLDSIVQSYYDVLRTSPLRSDQKPDDEVQESGVALAVGLVVGFIVLAAALGIIVAIIRRRRANNSDKIHYDTARSKTRKDSPPRPVVKKIVDFYPDTPYQPCEIEDNDKDTHGTVATYPRGTELSMVIEESERGEEETSESLTREVTPDVVDKKNVHA